MWLFLLILGTFIENFNSMPVTKNFASITWAHGVNDKRFLKTSLNSEIDMLEADILMGRLTDGKETEIAIMAHPPNDKSDLSLEQFVTIVDDFNKISPYKKGIKLDFKSIAAFETAVGNPSFVRILSEANYPVWLNADIVEGPLAPIHSKPVDPNRFLKGGKLFPSAILSLGWTTGYDINNQVGYSDLQIQNMLELLNLNEISQPITFAVRAGLVSESSNQIKILLENNKHTLTIWSGSQDEGFNVANLNNLLDEIGAEKIYIDVPEKLRNQLNLIVGNRTNVVRS